MKRKGRTTLKPLLPVSIHDLLSAYIEIRLKRKLKRFGKNVNRLENLLYWLRDRYGIKTWLDITPIMWDVYDLERETAGIKAETRKKELTELLGFLRFCEVANPDAPRRADLFSGHAPPVPIPVPNALNEKQERGLLAAAVFIHRDNVGWLRTKNGQAAWCSQWPQGAFYTLCLLGLRLGLRPGELQYLHWDEITFGNVPSIKLRELGCRSLKNRLASQRIALPMDCVQALREYQEATKARGELRDAVFAWPDDDEPGGWKAANYDHVWRALTHRMGTRFRLNAYILRHTFATRLVERDPPLDPHYRRRLLRHVGDFTAERYYIQRQADDPISVETGRVVG